MTAWTIITGATAGIGRALAEVLAAKGHALALVGRRSERLASLAEQLTRDFSVPIFWRAGSVTDTQFRQDFFCDLPGVPHILVNNAGLARGRDFFQNNLTDSWNEVLSTNVEALFAWTHLALPQMLDRGHGHVINVGSVAGRWAYPAGAVYCASKAAVAAFSEGLRLDLKGTGLRVCNILPGMVETEFSIVRFGSPVEAEAVYRGMTPLTAEDVARTIAWVIEQPPHVNIQEVVVFPTDQVSVTDVFRK